MSAAIRPQRRPVDALDADDEPTGDTVVPIMSDYGTRLLLSRLSDSMDDLTREVASIRDEVAGLRRDTREGHRATRETVTRWMLGGGVVLTLVYAGDTTQAAVTAGADPWSILAAGAVPLAALGALAVVSGARFKLALPWGASLSTRTDPGEPR